MITRSSGVRSVAAAAFAAVAVFVLIGNDQPAEGDPATVPATVLASGGSDDEKPPDREAVLEAIRGLLTALDLQPEDLLEDGDKGEDSEEAGDDQAGEDGADGKDAGDGADCPSETDCPASGAAATITIREYAFGAELSVEPGATVKVVNADTVPHNLTADDGGFATGDLEPNATATITAPREPGRYAFNCTLHRGMAGALVVGEGDEAEMGEHEGSGSR
jgi:plastocyanin